MNKVDLFNLEYVFIFDYYDQPLFFISRDDKSKKYYMFYLIEDGYYFFSALQRKEIDYLFSEHTPKEFLEFLEREQILRVIQLEVDSYEYLSNDEITDVFGETLSDLIPSDNSPIIYDYLSKQEMDSVRDTYQHSFPEFYDIRDMTVRIVNEKNDHVISADIVLDTIKFVKKIFDDLKKHSTANQTLAISSFSEGSFKIDFELMEPENMTLFEDDVYFDNIISFINDIDKPENSSDILIKDILDNKVMVEATKEFYSTVEEENLNIEFIAQDNLLAKINKSAVVESNLSNLESIIREQEKTLNVREQILSITGEVLSASKSRNGFRIRTIEFGEISGKFETNLFKKIKNSEVQITVSKSINAEIVRITETQPDLEYEKIKYIMNSFTQ